MRLNAGSSRNLIPAGKRFSAPFHSALLPRQLSVHWTLGFFPGGKTGRGVVLTAHRYRKIRAIIRAIIELGLHDLY